MNMWVDGKSNTNMILLFFIIVLQDSLASSTYILSRENTVCPSFCNNFVDEQKMQKCCVCNSVAIWEQFPVQELSLEYKGRQGIGVALDLNRRQHRLNTTLSHNYGYLSKFPINICHFQKTVKIDFSYNVIEEIGNISCLMSLDTLILTGNKIKVITNETFANLDVLRILKLSNNKIQRLDPGSLTVVSQGILDVDFSLNKMETVDVTNFIVEKPFCKISFKNNNITKMTNEIGFTLDTNVTYGEGGYVDLSNNLFSSWIDFKDISVTDITLVSKLFSFAFDLQNANWNCDCLMEPMLERAYDYFERNWRDYMNVTCYKPDFLQNQSIPLLRKQKKYDLFVCDYSNTSKCQFPCTCIEQPSRNRIIINCTNKRLHEIPLSVNIPPGENLELHFSENRISNVNVQSYFKRASFLNLSYNNIYRLDNNQLGSFQNIGFIDLKHNKIKKISKMLQRIDPCKIEFGNVTLPCTCNTLWLREWVENKETKGCKTLNEFTCKTNKGFIPVLDLTSEFLECVPWDPVRFILGMTLSLSILIALMVGFIYHYFQAELILLKRNAFRCHKQRIRPQFTFDVYISIDEDVDDLRQWTTKVLTKELEKKGYKVFLPCRDLLPGNFQEEHMNETISNSKNFLLILSESHFNSEMPWSKLEWKYMWNLFLQDVSRKIIIVNFDQLETSEIDQREIKAFSRLGLMLDFTNIRDNLLENIKLQLGTPRELTLAEKSLRNAKVRFNIQRIS